MKKYMRHIKVTIVRIEGLYIIDPAIHADSRGCFMETYNQKDMRDAGLDIVFVQDNQSRSLKGVLWRLHYQKEHLQGKQVYVVYGQVFDDAVHIRAGRKTLESGSGRC